ncbi:MAG: transporter substrate-binding domain-containing protein [Planctomycetes bacterium]|nr:transporter substrate-binding domain-containing protein [Planctomycetota bacterium]
MINHPRRATPTGGSLLPLVFLLGLFLGVAGGAGAAEAERAASGGIETLTDLNGKRIGVLAGTMLDMAANRFLDFTHFVYFDDSESQIQALLNGEIDAFVEDEPVANYLVANNPRLRRLDATFMDDIYGFALRNDDEATFRAVNDALMALIADGSVAELERKWLAGADTEERPPPPSPPRPPASDGAAVLRFGVSPVSAPFVYRNDAGRVVGMDIELMDRIAQTIGRELEVRSMEFSELLPSLLAGEVDAIGACLSITPERRALVRFTINYHEGGVAAVVLAD